MLASRALALGLHPKATRLYCALTRRLWAYFPFCFFQMVPYPVAARLDLKKMMMDHRRQRPLHLRRLHLKRS